MSSHCLKCKKNTESVNPTVLKTSNGKTMLLLKCTICETRTRIKRNIKQLRLKTPLSKVPLFGDILF